MSSLVHWPRILLTVFCLLLLHACAVAPPPKPVIGVDSRQLLDGLAENARRIQAVRGLAKVRVESPQRNLGATQVLLARKPAQLRTETLSLFGTPILLMASDGSRLQVLIPGQNRFYQGAASERNLRRFANLPMRLSDLVHLILYQVPLLPRVERLVSSPEGPSLWLSGDEGQRQELRFDNRLFLRRCVLSRQGETWLDVEYDDFQEDSRFPRQIALHLPRQKVHLDVGFQRLELNPELDKKHFVLSRPEGARLIELPGD